MRQELLTLLDHKDSAAVFGGTCVPHPFSFCVFFVVFCLSSSCILCAQCWQCLSIVCLHPVSCVPSIDSISGLFVFFLYLVCPVFVFSLDCLSSSSILCAQCWKCLSIVCFHPVSGVPSFYIFSRLFVVVLYLLCQLLTVSPNCLLPSCILCAHWW